LLFLTAHIISTEKAPKVSEKIAIRKGEWQYSWTKALKLRKSFKVPLKDSFKETFFRRRTYVGSSPEKCFFEGVFGGNFTKFPELLIYNLKCS
jgi:hypothetical protein